MTTASWRQGSSSTRSPSSGEIVHRHESHGAGTPEELGTMLEDACIAEDRDATARLFEHGAVLALPDAAVTAPGDIGRAATGLRAALAAPSRVVQVGDLALSVGSCIGVMRRGTDRAWRYAILAGTEGSP